MDVNMNTKTTRIADELKWTALRYRFYTVDQLEKAIEDGTLLGMLQANADAMYEGNLREVIAALRKNLSSQQTNMKKAKYVAPEAKDDWTRYNLLWEYTGKLAASTKPAASTLPITDKAKARWELTLEEIDSIPKDDYKTLDSIYQGMMSKKSKNPEQIEAVTTMSEFLDRLAYVSKLRSAAKEKGEKVEVPEAILEKLTKGGKATLSATEVEALLKALKK